MLSESLNEIQLRKEIMKLEERITAQIAATEKLKRIIIEELHRVSENLNMLRNELNWLHYGPPNIVEKWLPIVKRVEMVSGTTERFGPLQQDLLTYYSQTLRRHVSVGEVRDMLERGRRYVNTTYSLIENYNQQLKRLQGRYLIISRSYPDRAKPDELRKLLDEINELYRLTHILYTRKMQQW